MLRTSHGSPRLNTVSVSGNPWQVIAASAVGTMIEWYDFYIFGSLAVTISPLFYPEGNNILALIAYLSTFAVGFVVRPFGALSSSCSSRCSLSRWCMAQSRRTWLKHAHAYLG